MESINKKKKTPKMKNIIEIKDEMNLNLKEIKDIILSK